MIIHYPKKQKRRFPKLFAIIGIFFGFITLMFLLPEQSANSPIISPLARAVFPKTTPRQQKQSVLPGQIEQVLQGTTGEYSIYVKHLKTQETYTRKEHQVFEPASLYKLWVMGATYEAIENGSLSEDEALSESIANLNQAFSIDPNLAELTDGSINQSVKEALHQMITISHNYSALLLSKTLGLSTVSEYLTTHGLKESALGDPPETTAADIGLFLEQLYTGKLASPEHTEAMIELLKKQTLNHKLPRHLPKSVVIVHKTGELTSYSHDAGIVYTSKGNYIIVVMSNSDIPSGAEDRLADISKVVYQYFEGK